LKRLRIRVEGAVQGVGFRPFVHRRAESLGLTGFVRNSPEGVVVEAEGEGERLAAFLAALSEEAPPNAAVRAIETREVATCGDTRFIVRESTTRGTRMAEVPPDLATCAECLRELFDPADRRHLYPFINCTQCGPRFSIIEDMPYDRARTSMRRFPMCAACGAEYGDPSNRRFHAEPNACRECGPSLALWRGDGSVLARAHEALLAAAAAIREGCIVAVKGIGGFHLVADAANEGTIAALRRRKRRPEKPFAVMFPTLPGVAQCCRLSPGEVALLTQPAHSIVLLRRQGGHIAPSVAPNNPWLGVFLPYAPVHHLLLSALQMPIVATSGNMSDEPIVTDEAEALAQLAGIAELFLVHDRPIVRPIDDSVARIVCGRELVLRRARGYAPAPVRAPGVAPGILALGGHFKATVAFSTAKGVVLSQHLGDLETAAARAAHQRATLDTVQLEAARPRLVVRDLHPDYATSRAADKLGLPVASVQHHVAHVAACLAEHGLRPPALGVAWDGTGFGPDGTIWGGEFLHLDGAGWRRIAHLRRFRLPGGDAAAREPRRAALGLLYEAFGDDAFAMTDLPPVAAFSGAEREVLRGMLARGANAPVASSMGRLFDAFAALAALRQRASYEGQAAAELEWAGDGYDGAPPYVLPLSDAPQGAAMVVDWQPALEAALEDLRAGAAAGRISARLHAGLAAAIAAVAVAAGERRVALTGGCFQNARLTAMTVAALTAAGLEPIWHRRVPPNDGGIALGQAAWQGWAEEKGE